MRPKSPRSKPYEVQADGAAPKWTRFRRRFADKRAALRAAAARAKRGVDAGPVVVYDLRRPGTNVAICEWRQSRYHRKTTWNTKPSPAHGAAHAICRIIQPLRRRRKRT